jgi:hypothetical protein
MRRGVPVLCDGLVAQKRLWRQPLDSAWHGFANRSASILLIPQESGEFANPKCKRAVAHAHGTLTGLAARTGILDLAPGNGDLAATGTAITEIAATSTTITATKVASTASQKRPRARP